MENGELHSTEHIHTDLERARHDIYNELGSNPLDRRNDIPEEVVDLSFEARSFIVDATIEALVKKGLITESATRVLTVQETAERLGIHPNTLRRWSEKGLIRVVKLPTGVRRFRSGDVEQLHKEMWDGIAQDVLDETDRPRTDEPSTEN